ncbi:molybdenum cofactor guanylyltransferase [Psychromonas sp. CD1]|uniref:molybdenum cofactor guanylyltransferase n=1 Tax=Psychromonas sp. CD1 TaxID=1979839 RepID=UPI000B9B38FF|nr:molybdenum cofactor guanylyltransferase [Psychromonas sp. CD1]
MRIAGVVLAGGLSSRMGSDKASLLLAQKTLLKKAQELLLSLPLKDVFISGFYDGYRCIIDLEKGMGPIGALYSCEQTLCDDYDAMFIIPVDMPLLNLSVCQSLLQQSKHHKEGIYYENALFPLIIPLNSHLKKALTRIFNSDLSCQRSLYGLLKTLKSHALKASQEENFYLQNSNTPEQWQRCLTLYSLLKNQRKRNESPEQ